MKVSSNNSIQVATPGWHGWPPHGALRLLVFAAAAFPLCAPLAVSATGTAESPVEMMDHGGHHSSSTFSAPLLEKVREATEKYQDINVALHKEKGWVVGTPCVSGPDTGAMGVHIVMPSRTADGIIRPDVPEALIYEPLPGGAMRLVGVEFIQDAADWHSRYPNGPTPSLEGNLMNLVGAPNRYGLDPFYEIHVWAWEDNPKGNFADWNTHVTCDQATDRPIS